MVRKYCCGGFIGNGFSIWGHPLCNFFIQIRNDTINDSIDGILRWHGFRDFFPQFFHIEMLRIFQEFSMISLILWIFSHLLFCLWEKNTIERGWERKWNERMLVKRELTRKWERKCRSNQGGVNQNLFFFQSSLHIFFSSDPSSP